MLYTIFDPQIIEKMKTEADEATESVKEITPEQLVYTQASAETATINLILSNERSRKTVLKIYDKDQDRFQVEGKMTPILDSSIVHSLPTERADARKIASVIFYLKRTQDLRLLARILKAYPNITRLQRIAAHERAQSDLEQSESLDDRHRENLNAAIFSGAQINAGEILEVIHKEIPGFQKADQSEVTITIINYIGFLCFLDKDLGVLDGVVFSSSESLMEGLRLITKGAYASELKDRLLIDEPEYFDAYFPEFRTEYPITERTFVTPDSARLSRLLVRENFSQFTGAFASGLEATLKSMESVSFPQLANETLGKLLQNQTQEIVDTTIEGADLLPEEANTLEYSLYRTVAVLKLLDRQLKFVDKVALDEKNHRNWLADRKADKVKAQVNQLTQQHEKDLVRISTLIKSAETANSAIAQLDRLKTDLSDAKAEIGFLKEVAAVTKAQDEVTDQAEDIDTDAVIRRFNQKRCVFVGGDINWIQKMKSTLPEARFMDTDQLGRSKTLFQNANIIVLNVGTMNHSMSNKVRAAIATDAQLYYINSQQSNADKTIRYLAVAKNKN